MDTSNKELRITRVFDSPRVRVWKAWTDPTEIMKWWGPEGFTAPVCKVDLRVGGKYLYCMRGSAGPDQPVMDFWSGGTYQEIVPYEKIVCTDGFANEKGDVIEPATYGMPADFPRENIVTISFEDVEEGKKTRLTILYVAESDAALKAMIDAQMKEGWETSLDKFAASLKA